MMDIALPPKQGFWGTLKRPSIIYGTAFVLGLLFGAFISPPQQSFGLKAIADQTGTFFSILATNSAIVITLYISAIFTRIYAYIVYAYNGVILGTTAGWIITADPRLFLLILPHGLPEIFYLLATGYVVALGESFIRNNIGKYLSYLGLNLGAVLLCTFLETYITPLFIPLI